jgi:hypothetical protein
MALICGFSTSVWKIVKARGDRCSGADANDRKEIGDFRVLTPRHFAFPDVAALVWVADSLGNPTLPGI